MIRPENPNSVFDVFTDGVTVALMLGHLRVAEARVMTRVQQPEDL